MNKTEFDKRIGVDEFIRMNAVPANKAVKMFAHCGYMPEEVEAHIILHVARNILGNYTWLNNMLFVNELPVFKHNVKKAYNRCIDFCSRYENDVKHDSVMKDIEYFLDVECEWRSADNGHTKYSRQIENLANRQFNLLGKRIKDSSILNVLSVAEAVYIHLCISAFVNGFHLHEYPFLRFLNRFAGPPTVFPKEVEICGIEYDKVEPSVSATLLKRHYVLLCELYRAYGFERDKVMASFSDEERYIDNAIIDAMFKVLNDGSVFNRVDESAYDKHDDFDKSQLNGIWTAAKAMQRNKIFD